ncbi:MAG: hypothetical protein KDC27_22320 [Acidobacteria bacterium]|nr:hypothetical protein [Acidobacteriota bacterium]
MRTRWALAFLMAFALSAMPAMAGHRHGRGCGHMYSRAHNGWVSVNVATPYFGFSYSRAPRYDRYDDRHYGRYSDPYGGPGYGGGYGYWDPYRYDSRYDRHRGYWKHHNGHRHGYKDRCGR